MGILRINRKQLQFFFNARFASVIYADSMPRSGSTAVFNALRLILAENAGGDLQSSWVRDARHLPRASVYLIKIHGMNTIDAWRASKIIYSYRDPRVALVSLMRKFDIEPQIEVVRNWLRDFAFAEQHADLLLRYETMRDDMPAAIRAMGAAIGQDVDGEYLAKQVDILSNKARTPRTTTPSVRDNVTLLYNDHVTNTKDDDWRTVLPANLNTQIVDEFGPWLKRHGYPLR